MKRETSSKVDDLYRRLKKQIVMSTLVPGQQLVELELASTLGCSQSTVREALLRLQEDGLIVRQGYRGTSVSAITPAESQIFLELRTLLEVAAAKQALTRLQETDLIVLRKMVEDMEAAAEQDDGYALFEKDLDFHMHLFKIADLPALAPVLMRCSMYNHRSKIAQANRPRTLLETAQRHRNIIDAMEAGDADIVEEILSHHVVSIFGARKRDVTTDQADNRMSAAMQAVHNRMLIEDALLPEISSLPIAQGRKQFIACNRRWNTIEDNRFDIRKLRIPANPLSRFAKHDIPAVQIHPKGGTKRGTILHIHGGGWTFGSNETHLGAMARLAEDTACTVIGIEYTLAPEAPFPAGLNDCTWAWRWLRSKDESGLPWFVVGDSSGANLALSMLLDLRNVDEQLPEAALLFYGVYSNDLSTESHRCFGQGDFGLTSARMAWYIDNYQAANHKDAALCRLFPLEANLQDLPPLFITAAGLDPLRDDSLKLIRKLSKTNTPFDFKQYPGVIHGFMQMGSVLPEARAAFSDAANFITSRTSHPK